MAIVTKTRTYSLGDSLTAPYYNQDRDEMIAGINSINNTQIASGAGILESKLAFSTSSGHNHDGVNSKLVSVPGIDFASMTALQFVRCNAGKTALETAPLPVSSMIRGYLWFLKKTLIVESDASTNPVVLANTTATNLTAYVKTAPTGADIIIAVKNTSGTTIATLTIPAGNTSATTSTMTNPNITAGTFLRFDVTQVGSIIAGADITVTLQCTDS